MKKIKEILSNVKILWCFIAGLMITALFTILLPIGVSFFPCILLAILIFGLSGKDVNGKRDWYSAIAVILGALYIWALSL
jgi:hypothetical protein